MDIHQLETFLAVVEEGSFSGAAKALGRTQPAVSQVIGRLEDELGQRLFERPARRGGMTDAGKALVEYAQRLITVREQARVALEDVRALRAGRLAIAANELTCLYLLPVLDRFRRLYPGVSVTVQRSLASRVPASVLDYAVDLGVTTYRPAEPGLRAIVVYRDQLVFVVPPSHPLARRPEVSITMLGSESFVAHHVASPFRDRVVEAFRTHRVALQMPVEMPTIDAIKRFVALGHGVALLPGISVEDELRRGELVRVPVPELAMERPLRLVLRREGELSHAVRAFLSVAEHHATTAKGAYSFVNE
ncbi:MAG: LysR family transcriptional regulator [Acidobacteria bacterium]|nr:LysR family transcriptional regulator [Acidobacteriota bacterium]